MDPRRTNDSGTADRGADGEVQASLRIRLELVEAAVSGSWGRSARSTFPSSNETCDLHRKDVLCTRVGKDLHGDRLDEGRSEPDQFDVTRGRQ